MNAIKKIFGLLGLFAWVMCLIGGTGYCIYGGSWVIAVACVWTAIMAFPKMKENFKKMVE